MDISRLFKSWLFLLVTCFCSNLLLAQTNPLDSAKKVFGRITAKEKAYIQTSLFIADQFMDVEQYDSAQDWLNKIHDKIPAKKTSLFNYYLTSRQAEVYYYNNLQQLGLQESFRGLQIAKELNDSLLILDSYNFLGIFYMNLDSGRKAVSFFKKGLTYVQKTNNSVGYIELSKPLHLYGNLSEAYYKIDILDSALKYVKISLAKSYKRNWGRGIAVGHVGSGDIYFKLNQIDSAIINYTKGKNEAMKNQDIDIELLCYGGLAKAFNSQNKYAQSQVELEKGFELLSANPNLNRNFSLQFLTAALNVYQSKNDKIYLIKTLELKSTIESKNLSKNNSQLQTILKASVENEKKLLTLEIQEANQKKELANTRLLILLIAFVLVLLGFFIYRQIQKQKLATAAMRQKISQDLHDDIGASLSSLHIYSSIAEKNIYTDPVKSKELIQKIYTQSQHLMNNMNDIVWSMKPASDGGTTLETQVKNFGAELLNDIDINFTYQLDAEVEKLLLSIFSRRNLLLIIKEALNNIAKHSQSTVASLTLAVTHHGIVLTIVDNGMGFDMQNKKEGNGLANIYNRVTELNGNINIQAFKNTGTQISIQIPKSSFKE